jgi:hypothetical protein
MTHARIAIGILSLVLALSARAFSGPVPEQLRGDWVPAKGGCDSPLRFRALVDTVELVNGKDREVYGGLEWPTGFFGPDYQGISVVGIPEFEGSQPFYMYFNADEKKGITKLQILAGEEVPGREALNAPIRAAKKLNGRFPLHDVELKKCPAK